MELFLKKIKTIFSKRLIIVLAVFFILLTLPVAAWGAYEYFYQGKIYPGVTIDNIDFGGLTKEEAINKINNKINLYQEEAIVFAYENNEKSVSPIVSSFAGDFTMNIISLDASETADNLYSFGRSNDFWKNLKNKLSALQKKIFIPAEVEINKGMLELTLKDYFAEFAEPAQNATIQFNLKNSGEEKEILITDEKNGKTINYQKGIDELESNLKNLENKKIKLETKEDQPTISKSDLLATKDEIEELILRLPIILKNNNQEWKINEEIFFSLLAPVKKNGEVSLTFSEESLTNFLKENIASEIDAPAQNAKFEIKDGQITEFQPHRSGQELNILKNVELITESFWGKATSSVELVIEEKESDIKIGEINNFGIREIIGTGHSNFAGSPANRRHNIKNGSETVAGTLIAPGEEFSLVNVLGEVDGESGYLPELVIKGNQTIPEYGGGLCQVATTLFRVALDSGLEITERRNHSYRVSYYEPAGTDATVYTPRPDFKFKNDTPYHILIQYRISGNDLYFDFWGTEDGRIAETSYPTIYNIVSPAPTRLVETLDLPVGEKKCTERAHNGADAYFDYKVIYPNGELHEERFTSHYIPWQEVCLIGVEELSVPSEEEIKDEEANEENTTDSALENETVDKPNAIESE